MQLHVQSVGDPVAEATEHRIPPARPTAYTWAWSREAGPRSTKRLADDRRTGRALHAHTNRSAAPPDYRTASGGWCAGRQVAGSTRKRGSHVRDLPATSRRRRYRPAERGRNPRTVAFSRRRRMALSAHAGASMMRADHDKYVATIIQSIASGICHMKQSA